MTYKVTKQFNSSPGREQPCGQFKTEKEAREFALESAESDASMKIHTVYRIYDFDEILTTINSNSIQFDQKSSDASGGSQGQKSGATFRPSPLQTAPRPSGMPANNWSKPEDDEKDKK